MEQAGLPKAAGDETGEQDDSRWACVPNTSPVTVPAHLPEGALALRWSIRFARASPGCFFGALELGHLTTQPGQQFVV